MSQTFLRIFLVLAATGFMASLAAHIGALAGEKVFANPLLLTAGIFVVWLPTISVSQRLVKDFRQKDFWKAALRGCPEWMRRGVMFIFAYAFVNFAVFLMLVPAGPRPPGAAMTLAEIRGFTGHFMIFYAVAFATLYSAIQTAKTDPLRRCLDGHPVDPAAKFCDQCGAKVISKS